MGTAAGMTRPGRRPRRRRLVVALLACVVIVLTLGIVLAARSLGLYRDLQQAQRALTDAGDLAEGAGASITSDQAREVVDRLHEADDALDRAAAALDSDPFINGAALLPPVARQLDAAAELVRATRTLTGRWAAIGSMLEGYVAARDGAAGPQRIAAFVDLAARLRPQVDELAGAVAEAKDIAGAVSADGLVEPLVSARTQLTERLDRVEPLVATVKTASTVLPSIMGHDGRRRYLVLALDNAEIRPIGGLIAAFATPTFEDGSLSDLAFKDIQEIDRRDQQTYVQPPDALADHLLGDFTWQVADAGWWPDFATSVADVRRLYKVETGEDDFQGVIAFTPELVDRLLEVVGPVTVEGAGITVKPGDTYLVSLEQVEVLHRGEGRKAFLADLASQVLERLYALPPSRYPEVLAALDEAGKRRQLQIQFDDPEAQAVVDSLGWPGGFTFPENGDRLAIVEANVAPVSKLDVLLSLDHALDVQLAADGSATETARHDLHEPLWADPAAGPRTGPLDLLRRRSSGATTGATSCRTPRSSGSPATIRPSPSPTRTASSRSRAAWRSATTSSCEPGTVHLTTRWYAPDVVVPATTGSAGGGTYRLTYRKQAGRDGDTLTVRVTVPDGMKPTSWSDGGVLDGDAVTFDTTSEFDRTFEVAFGPAAEPSAARGSRASSRRPAGSAR